MAGILIYSDKDNLALELLTAANTIAGYLKTEVRAVTINNDIQAEILSEVGADVYKIQNEALFLADVRAVSSVIKQVADKLNIDIVLLSSNRRGRELAGRLAQMMEAGCLTDVFDIDFNNNMLNCQRNTMGGATVATQCITTEKKVIALRPKTFDLAQKLEKGNINIIDIEVKSSGVRLININRRKSNSANIEMANILVAIGQGLNSYDDLKLIEKLARTLGGEIACSKPLATDKKWLPEDRIIGLSGKKCKPDLIFILGISGQVQFTVGIREAGVIVSINNDENAYINQIADYILIDDLHEAAARISELLIL